MELALDSLSAVVGEFSVIVVVFSGEGVVAASSAPQPIINVGINIPMIAQKATYLHLFIYHHPLQILDVRHYHNKGRITDTMNKNWQGKSKKMG